MTAGFPPAERFGLVAQFRRAAVSSASNIAEGHGREGPRETAHGLSVALGSLAEIDSLVALAEDLGYLPAEHAARLDALRMRASQLTYGLLRRLRRDRA